MLLPLMSNEVSVLTLLPISGPGDGKSTALLAGFSAMAGQRERIRMTDAEVEEFLASERTLQLAVGVGRRSRPLVQHLLEGDDAARHLGQLALGEEADG